MTPCQPRRGHFGGLAGPACSYTGRVNVRACIKTARRHHTIEIQVGPDIVPPSRSPATSVTPSARSTDADWAHHRDRSQVTAEGGA